MVEVKALREAAEAATPGPWDVYERPKGGDIFGNPEASFIHCGEDAGDDTGYSLIARVFTRDGYSERQANARFIALANPATVLALLKRVEELEGAEASASRLLNLIEGGLMLTGTALRAGDPVSEINFRVRDLQNDISRQRAALSAARGE